MTRYSFVPLTLAILACAEASPDATAPITPQPKVEYRVSGTVRDQAGRPLPEATVEVLLAGGFLWRGIQSDSSGSFSFFALRGPVLFRVWKDWYKSYAAQLTLTEDVTIDTELSKLSYSDTIAFGKTVQSYVHSLLPPCDPVHWDALAPCRVFRVVHPSGGFLTVSVSWAGDPDLDIAITTEDGRYLGTSYDNPGAGTVMARAYLEPGTVYQVRVSSYYGDQVFDVSAELR
jgi:hypothetical protein